MLQGCLKKVSWWRWMHRSQAGVNGAEVAFLHVLEVLIRYRLNQRLALNSWKISIFLAERPLSFRLLQVLLSLVWPQSFLLRSWRCSQFSRRSFNWNCFVEAWLYRYWVGVRRWWQKPYRRYWYVVQYCLCLCLSCFVVWIKDRLSGWCTRARLLVTLTYSADALAHVKNVLVVRFCHFRRIILSRTYI